MIKLAAQLYTLREYCQNERDLDISLGRVADIGYSAVQLSGVGPIPPERVRKLCDGYSLEIALTHTDPERILRDTEGAIVDHKVLGCRYVGIGGLPHRYRQPEWFDRFFADFAEPMEKLKAAGMLLMYHNHDFELEPMGGKTLLARLVEGAGPQELGFTLDTYWLQAAGADSAAWIERLRGRVPCVHLKDMEMAGGKAVMAPVLEGNMNFDSIWRAMETARTEYAIVEQDVCRESAFVCLEKSFKNLQRYL